MTYDFDEPVNRRGTNSYKWDSTDYGTLPMWVADMDFRTAPRIIDALAKRVAHGVFGYVKVPQAYYDAIDSWFTRRHGWHIATESIIYTSGVVPAISAIIKALTQKGDKVIVQTPSYNCFFSSIRNNGCILSANKLKYDHGTYSMDFEDLEHRAADDKAKIMLLCNPHNPVGRVWTKEELRKVGEICMKHGVFIISDEIHCELTYPNHDYTPFATVSEDFLHNTAVCVSPSKAFNIAGLQIANIVANDESIRKKIDRAINDNEVCDVNPFGVEALIAAYDKSEDWLDELRSYLFNNYQLFSDFFADKLPDFKIPPLEGTYLVWIDCSTTGKSGDEIASLLKDKENLLVNPGSMYGPGGENFIRVNIACPKARVKDALNKIYNVLSVL